MFYVWLGLLAGIIARNWYIKVRSGYAFRDYARTEKLAFRLPLLGRLNDSLSIQKTRPVSAVVSGGSLAESQLPYRLILMFTTWWSNRTYPQLEVTVPATGLFMYFVPVSSPDLHPNWAIPAVKLKADYVLADPELNASCKIYAHPAQHAQAQALLTPEFRQCLTKLMAGGRTVELANSRLYISAYIENFEQVAILTQFVATVDTALRPVKVSSWPVTTQMSDQTRLQLKPYRPLYYYFLLVIVILFIVPVIFEALLYLLAVSGIWH
jgi:hypothetical protein